MLNDRGSKGSARHDWIASALEQDHLRRDASAELGSDGRQIHDIDLERKARFVEGVAKHSQSIECQFVAFYGQI